MKNKTVKTVKVKKHDWRDNVVNHCPEFYGEGQTCHNMACPYAVGTRYSDGYIARCVDISREPREL